MLLTNLLSCPTLHQEVARLTAELTDSAAALRASKQQAKAAAASLAGLQPELAAARGAVAQHKETRRLTIERRSQVRIWLRLLEAFA